MRAAAKKKRIRKRRQIQASIDRRAYDDPKFNKMATVLGHLSMQWARHEGLIDAFIEMLTPLEEGDISRSIIANMDFRGKIQALKALAFLRRASPEWFADLIRHLDYIDNELRPERNKYIHSEWFVPQGVLTRVSRRVRLRRPQAFKEHVLTTEEAAQVRLAEARKLCVKLQRAWLETFEFFHFHYQEMHLTQPAPNASKP